MKIPSLLTSFAVMSAAIILSGCQTQKPAPTASAPASSTSPTVIQGARPDATTPAESTGSTESASPGGLVLNQGAYRIKAGMDSSFTDSQGRVWQADQGFDGGDTADRDADTKITGTSDPKMYLTEHYAMNSFTCKVPNGKYTANLYFAETYEGITGPGQRVFSFNVMGQEFKDVDLFVKAGGPDRAYEVSVPVEVTNGVFKIDFTTQIENPEINAIELVPNP